MKGRLFILSLAFALAIPTFAQKQDDMRQTVEYLASQELGGRYPGSAGDTLASEFIKYQLRGLKLKRIVKGKKKLGYFHNFTYGKTEQRHTHNIIAVLPGKDKKLKHEYILVGSHYDHLGMGGKDSGSRRPDTLAVHPGADDNASGDAVVLELAKHFKKARQSRSIIFAFFGAEEQGLIGSKQFVEWMKKEDTGRKHLPNNIKGIVAMVNLDMVGRMRDNSLSVSGTGTSSIFKALAEQVAEKTSVNISCTADGYGPSDQASFVAADIPVLYLTTGGHMEYHTPADVPSTINYDGMQQTLNYTKELVTSLANLPDAPDFINVPSSTTMSHASFKVTMGLMPDVTGASTIPGLRADIVVAGKPAHKAGMKSGDIIQEIDGKPVNDINEYMERLSELKAGTTIPVKVLRGEETIILQVELNPEKP
ncbi:MAG: M20/M25/M40 family metallo-hydrolase [Bacteroidaceae bacterium]|nr:M20/M25/M40 family metallo-hydrolase [Bacteroidaceae bacterium]